MAMAARCAISVLGVAYLLVTMVAAHDYDFGYSGANGPDKWGSVNSGYKLCSSGKSQSPIDIKKKDLVYNTSLTTLNRDYTPTNATLINTGFDIELIFDKGAGTMSLDGDKYTLLQLHWHTPSEHTLDGEQYSAELQLVHQSDNGSIAIIAILYDKDDKDSFLDDLKDQVEQLSKESCSDDEEVHVDAGEVDPKTLRRHTRKYYRYVGSLTTPPCTENVTWIILGKVRSISKDQVAALQAPLGSDYKNNSRPTQGLNGRTVQLYDEGRKN